MFILHGGTTQLEKQESQVLIIGASPRAWGQHPTRSCSIPVKFDGDRK